MAAMHAAPCYSLRGEWLTHAEPTFLGFSHVVQQRSVLNGGAPKQAVFIDHSSFASKVRIQTSEALLGSSLTKVRTIVHWRQVGRLV